MLWLYAVLAVFIGKFALRGNTLFPERAARRKIARRNPTLGLANHEHPLSEFDRRLIVLRDAIFHVGAIALAGRRTEVERVERETRMAGFILLIVKSERPLDVDRLRNRLFHVMDVPVLPADHVRIVERERAQPSGDGQLLCANSGRNQTVRRTGQVDPERPFAAGPMNRRSAPESRLRRYGNSCARSDRS